MGELTTVETDDYLSKVAPDLTDKQRAYVYEYVRNGGQGGEAARTAGYAGSGADGMSSRMLRNPMIIKAIYELSVMHLGALVPGALGKIAKLSQSAKSEYVQLEASKDLLERVGMRAPKQVQVAGDIRIEIDLG